MTLEALKQLIEKEVSSLELKTEPENLYEPVGYILSLGGKRIRPLLVLLGYALFKKNPESIIKPALSVEVFHNFTLMHDDIMDKAPIRRGMATVHEKWNETIAILSGDVMMIRAYELLSQVSPEQLPEALRLFNQCGREVCEGQQMDVNFESRAEVGEEEYLEMIRLKTAVLLGFSLRLGALLAGANESDQAKLYDLGINLGLAFQLMDDHLDSFGNEATFGKQIGGDILLNKKTFLLIKTLESGIKTEELNQWIGKDPFESKEKIEAVKAIYKEAGVFELSLNKIKGYEERAEKILSELDGDRMAKDAIMGFIEQLKKRVE